MKKLTKAFCLFLTVVLLALSVSAPAYAVDIKKPLRFGADGKFRIMHVTDTHLSNDNAENTLRLLGMACDKEQPDLVVIGGDNVSEDTKEEIKDLSQKLMSVFNDRNIPVAATFGNHDSENPDYYTREELMAIYNTFPCSYSVDDGALLTGCGTYLLPVYGTKGIVPAFNVWVFDSGDYDDEGHYANVAEDQVLWYKTQSLASELLCGKKVPSVAFQHIIVPEIYEALEKVKVRVPYSYEHMYNDGEYYRFNPAMTNYGCLHETPCCGYYNHGQFDALVERGDVLGIFTGHDHTNAFGVKYKGIDIVNSLSSRYNGDAFSTQYGYRIVEIDEKDPSTYITRVVHWFDFVNADGVSELAKDAAAKKMLNEIRFKGAFQKLGMNLGVFFVQLFGRQVKYAD